MEYRVHVTIRRKGEPIFTSHEYKTEHYEDLEELNHDVNHFILDAIEEDIDERGEDDDTTDDI